MARQDFPEYSQQEEEDRRRYLLNEGPSAQPMAEYVGPQESPLSKKQRRRRIITEEPEELVEVATYKERRLFISVFRDHPILSMLGVVTLSTYPVSLVGAWMFQLVWARFMSMFHTSFPMIHTPAISPAVQNGWTVFWHGVGVSLFIGLIVYFIAYLLRLAWVVLLWSRTYYLAGPDGIGKIVYGIPVILKQRTINLAADAIDSVDISEGRVRARLFHYGTVYNSFRQHEDLRQSTIEDLDNTEMDLREITLLKYPHRYKAALNKAL